MRIRRSRGFRLSLAISLTFVAGVSAQTPHLLISEFCVGPTEFEYVGIYNPGGSIVDLSNYYVSDNNTYYGLVNGTQSLLTSDFLLRFPAGATITPHTTQYVALDASVFFTSYARLPEYEFGTATDHASVPNMRLPFAGAATSSSGLTNTSEMIVLFYWNGSSNLVQDVDYVAYGTTSSNFSDKSSISVNGSVYQNDVAVALQLPAQAPALGFMGCRQDTTELNEAASGGNGISGHNETSENFAVVFLTTKHPDPKNPALGNSTSAPEEGGILLPSRFSLEQNYPNPFNPETRIEFRIQKSGFTRLSVHDLLGREVAVLVNEEKMPGTYTVTWDARLHFSNSGGQAGGMTSGVYFCRMQAGEFVQTRKLVLLR